ncbi:Chanoclavine-I aldehyde reductase fgaOx3 [Psilocybe cubensis]|uniref:NADH:flavin oxidoreductase/NADH oxidase N-terminal domain-containing protein n=2 Tax=Psilocybe cubensis TaxID=181762 RepID=A0A8H8CEJ9_PSICU|nr:Chanoclavine-I aldehyde reductase fgaOx3 [Psilocybe cubensis]KAH9476516.1 Chanoclavine-I aldehyde reductase fgaOx3 [Psilocybe cubensis]
MSSKPVLFTPIQVGNVQLKHRIVLAPLTRNRSSQKEHVPTIPLMQEYYAQRGSIPGTLLITEATFITAEAGGDDNIPGIWSPAQIEAWKKVTDAVHGNKSYIYLQLWALGRAATPATLREDGYDFVAPSPIPMKPDAKDIPRALTVPEIKQYVKWYATAAHNAVHLAGFDGVEVHNANGYLLDQFVQDVSNQRDDEYGGSIEARSKFSLEVVDAVVKEVGAERVGIRVSPWSMFQAMKMADPIPQFTYLISSLLKSHPNLAYLHAIEARAGAPPHESNDFLRHLWRSKPDEAFKRVFISADGYKRDTAIARAEKDSEDGLVAFGKAFLANPDLPFRLENDLPLNTWNFKTFFSRAHLPGTEIGYTDYPFSSEFLNSAISGINPTVQPPEKELEKSNL